MSRDPSTPLRFAQHDTLATRHLGLKTHVIILDGCRGIELEAGDIDRALDEMKRSGAILLQSSDLWSELPANGETISRHAVKRDG